jgi:hypothetical protein
MASDPASIDELLATIGKLVLNATANESFMFTAFKILSRNTSKIARATFYTLDSLPGKRTLLNRVVEAVGDEEDKKLVKEIIAAAEKSSNQRREVAHALTMFEGPLIDAPFTLFHPKSSESKPVTKDWLATLMRHSHEAFAAGHQAFERLAQKHGVPATAEL